jgi:secreted Zn-dependent insulinase-like peptidase
MVDSEEDEQMAAAALCVNVGGFSDPSDLVGLANFLGHMVFRGSNKFPEENAFDKLLEVTSCFRN